LFTELCPESGRHNKQFDGNLAHGRGNHKGDNKATSTAELLEKNDSKGSQGKSSLDAGGVNLHNEIAWKKLRTSSQREALKNARPSRR